MIGPCIFMVTASLLPSVLNLFVELNYVSLTLAYLLLFSIFSVLNYHISNNTTDLVLPTTINMAFKTYGMITGFIFYLPLMPAVWLKILYFPLCFFTWYGLYLCFTKNAGLIAKFDRYQPYSPIDRYNFLNLMPVTWGGAVNSNPMTLNPVTPSHKMLISETLKFLKKLENLFNLQSSEICATDLIQKPLRSKHCTQTNACYARFDHYCPWIANVVAQNTHFTFIWYLFFVLSVDNWHAYGCYLHIKQSKTWVSCSWSTVLLCQIGIYQFWLFALWAQHVMSMVISNITSNEQIKRQRKLDELKATRNYRGIPYLKGFDYDFGIFKEPRRPELGFLR